MPTMQVLLLALALPQDPPPKPTPAACAAEISAYVEPFAAIGHFSGTLLVARGDEILLEKSWGLASRELDVPNGPETRFCVASVTKPMTVALAIKLIEEGALQATDHLAKWVPDFPKADVITVTHLLNHRAGIPHRVTTREQEVVPHTAADMVEFAKRKELLLEPGAESVYSSAGFSVLARVLELAGGKSYAELLQEKILAPAGLQHTAHVDSTVILPGRASSHRIVPGGFRNSALQDLSFLVGAGSVWSTPRDLFRLQRAIVGGKLGASVKANTMRANGFRWNGVTSGFRTFADYYSDTEVTVIFSGNVISGANDLVQAAVPRIVAGEAVARPEVPRIESVEVADAVLESYRGDYQLRPGSTIGVRPQDGVLVADDWVLVPTSKTTFFSPQDYAVVEVILDDKGEPLRLDWKRPNGTSQMPRVGK